MLHIKVIQAVDDKGVVVLAKNVEIVLENGDSMEILYKITKPGSTSKKVLMEEPCKEEDKPVKEFDSWLSDLPNGKEQ
jgi:hypothetical protein